MTQHETGNRARVQRYRAKHRRIDYAPSAAALEIIETWLVRKLDNCTVGVIDRLIPSGHRAISEMAAVRSSAVAPPILRFSACARLCSQSPTTAAFATFPMN